MLLKPPRKLTKTIGFRLTLWYSAIFVSSSVLLFIIGYFLLSSTLEQQDREAVLLKLKELAALYETGGTPSVERQVRLDERLGEKNPFFIRVASSRNKTLFLGLPSRSEAFSIEKVEETASGQESELILIPARDGRNALMVASTRLVDGSLLQVGRSAENRERILGHFRETFVAVIIPLILFGFMGGAFFAFRALRPIRSLIQTVRSIDVEKMQARVPSPRSGDELDELVRLFNEMLDRIGILINVMKASLDHVAHDLRTPMTRFRGIAQMALESGHSLEGCKNALADCVEESERILKLLDALMDISEAETGVMQLDLQVLEVLTLIEGVVDLYRYVAEERAVLIHVTAHQGIFVRADRTRMGQALANLLDNAIKYTPRGGHVYLAAQQHSKQVVITIRDTGIGIPKNEVATIWDRFYRGDQGRSEKGLGLGLSLVRAIVQAHKGRVEVVSGLGEGAIFTLYLPTELTHSS
jgi:signal transduction histidine kinase